MSSGIQTPDNPPTNPGSKSPKEKTNENESTDILGHEMGNLNLEERGHRNEKKPGEGVNLMD